jgi:hypothetical protein
MFNRLSRLALSLALVSAAPTVAAELRVGAAAEVITPPVGTPMDGYYSPRQAEGVDDDLYAKAIVIERDGVKAALVVCDLITMPHRVTDEARRLIATSPAAIPGEHVMISATHTHTGPSLLRGSTRDPAEGEVGARAKAYTDSLPALIAKAVQRADANLAPARVQAGVGHKEGISFNRRYVMKDGSIGWNPGKLNPKIVRPTAGIDPAVAVVYFDTADDAHKPIATHVNFALHPDTVGSSRISADYPGALAAALAKAKGPDMLTVFANGACGDINHIDVSTDRKQQGIEEARRIGTALGEEVIKTYEKLSPVVGGPVRARREVLPLPLAEVKPEEFEAARDAVLKPGKARMSMDRVKAFKVLDVAARKGKPLDAEVQVIALGDDVAWVALPGEIFVELGLDLKKRSPFKHTIIVELANGSVGYVPTKRAFAEGNYEPVSARCAPGSGEMIADAAVRILNELHGAK